MENIIIPPSFLTSLHNIRLQEQLHESKLESARIELEQAKRIGFLLQEIWRRDLEKELGRDIPPNWKWDPSTNILTVESEEDTGELNDSDS